MKKFRFSNRIASMLLAVLIATMAIVVPASAQESNPPAAVAFTIQLPEVIDVNVADNGGVEVMGLPLSLINDFVPSFPSSLDSRVIAMTQELNLQHIELAKEGTKFTVYLNGGTDVITMDASPETATLILNGIIAGDKVFYNGAYGTSSLQKWSKVVDGAMKILSRFDTRVIVHFPVKSGMAVIPVRVPSADTDQVPASAQESNPPAAVAFTIQLPEVIDVNVADNGGVEVMGLPLSLINDFVPSFPSSLDSRVIAMTQELNLQHIELAKEGTKFTVYLNGGTDVITMDASPETATLILNGIIAGDKVFYNGAYGTSSLQKWSKVVDGAMKILSRFDTRVIVHFPVKSGMAVIPVRVPSATPAATISATPATISATQTPSATPTPAVAVSATPTPAAADLVDVTCKDGQTHTGLTPEEAAHACPEGGEDW